MPQLEPKHQVQANSHQFFDPDHAKTRDPLVFKDMSGAVVVKLLLCIKRLTVMSTPIHLWILDLVLGRKVGFSRRPATLIETCFRKGLGVLALHSSNGTMLLYSSLSNSHQFDNIMIQHADIRVATDLRPVNKR